jgi:cytochrome b6-f complex iron-sulfur subunit
MEKAGRTRRRFLKGIIWGGVCSLLAWRFLVPGDVWRKKPLLQVKKSDVPQRGALVFRQARVAVIRRQEEIYALSLVCTHLGCTVNVTPQNLICPCHGSVFDREGAVLKGPSNRPLERLEVQDQGETLVVMA